MIAISPERYDPNTKNWVCRLLLSEIDKQTFDVSCVLMASVYLKNRKLFVYLRKNNEFLIEN